MYREKIELFLEVIAKSQDNDCVDLIEDLLSSSCEYMKRVVVLESVITVGRYNKEGSEYREAVQRLDSSRSEAHNSLIANTKAVNNLCRRYDIPIVFEGNEEKRIEIAEFAQQLADEYFSTRRL